MAPVTLSVDFAVRLADEGVPLRAIARATNMSSEDLRESLTTAQSEGRLIELPRDDWPPGFPRDQRALQLSRMVVANKEVVHLAVQHTFGMTPTEVQVLMLLIQNPIVAKTRSDMSSKAVDVFIHHIRKRLLPFGIKIITLWGYGYKLSVEDRRQTMDLILKHVAGIPTL